MSDCDAESMTIDPLISDALSYQWLVDGEPFSTDPVLNLPLNAGDSYDVVLQFTNELCESSIHYLVTAPILPEATISFTSAAISAFTCSEMALPSIIVYMVD